MTQTWRLIHSPPAPGAWNMAVDEAILTAVGDGDSPPTLRLYDWSPPCLSLGYGQRFRDVDLPRLAARQWDVVRRPTGGRAILHVDELTYAVIAPLDHPLMRGDIRQSYQRLSRGLLAFLEILSVPADAQPITLNGGGTEFRRSRSAPPAQDEGPVCFEIPANWEITANGKKLVGSAQMRRHNAVLQHGTIPLYGDLARITEALAFEDESARQEAAARLLERAATVESVLGRRVGWEEAAGAFEQGLAQSLGLALIPGELTHPEAARAEALLMEKYGNREWVARR